MGQIHVLQVIYELNIVFRFACLCFMNRNLFYISIFDLLCALTLLV